MDDQVKIDGFRIELAEIETVFASNELLDKAVAVVREGKLVLYIKTLNSKQLDHTQLDQLNTQAGRSNFPFAVSGKLFTCTINFGII